MGLQTIKEFIFLLIPLLIEKDICTYEGDGFRSSWHAFWHHEEKYTEWQEDSYSQRNLFSCLRREAEHQEGNGRYEGAWHHQIKEIVQLLSLQKYIVQMFLV